MAWILNKKAFVILGVGVIFCFSAIALGFFPVARVDGKFIWYREIMPLTRAAKAMQETVGSERVSPLLQSMQDPRRAALHEIIVRSLIERSLDEFGRADIEARVEKEVQNIASGDGRTSIERTLKKYYNMNYKEFERTMIIPSMTEVVLRERVEAKTSSGYSAWIEGRAKSADVKVFFLPYVWRDGRLENK